MNFGKCGNSLFPVWTTASWISKKLWTVSSNEYGFMYISWCILIELSFKPRLELNSQTLPTQWLNLSRTLIYIWLILANQHNQQQFLDKKSIKTNFIIFPGKTMYHGGNVNINIHNKNMDFIKFFSWNYKRTESHDKIIEYQYYNEHENKMISGSHSEILGLFINL